MTFGSEEAFAARSDFAWRFSTVSQVGQEQFGVDDVDVVEGVDAAGYVDDFRVVEAADDVGDGVGGADVAEELVA